MPGTGTKQNLRNFKAIAQAEPSAALNPELLFGDMKTGRTA
jgi:hypothetical protein